jgi:putative ABC transport system permease protein
MRWYRRFFWRRLAERQIDAELRFHLDQQIADYVAAGIAAEEARRRARLEFGGLEQMKEQCRDVGAAHFLETLLQDVRYGLRMLAKTPAFTATAVLTLALGIGANTAIFSVVDAVLLHSLPYQNPAQLVTIGAINPQGEKDAISPGDFADWSEQARAFQGLAAYKQMEFHVLAGAGEPDEVWASPVSSNLFHVLGVNVIRGRTFDSNESHALVLSHQYWRSHFSLDPNIIGKTLALDGKPYTVVGIAPSDFEFPHPDTQMWTPLTFSVADRNNREDHTLSVIARLQTGVTAKQAQAEMDTLARRLGVEYPKTNAGWRAPVEPFRGRDIGDILRAAIFTLLGAVAFVLMIVCANVASMLLARGAARRGEMAIRSALGAGRWRLIRQLLVESLMLAGAASVAGLALAFWGLDTIVGLVPKYNLVETQAVHRIAINLPVLGFTVALSLLTGIVVGLLPALRVSKLNLSDSLKESGRTSGTSTRRYALQRALVVSEVALALVLLVGAGLMIQSFERLQGAPMGFNPDHVLTVRVPLASYRYSPGPQSVNFYRAVMDRIKAIPGVKAVGMANNLPFTGFHTSGIIPLPGKSPGVPGGTLGFTMRSVSPGYFQTMGIPLQEGRDFALADSERDARCVRIVNQAMAHQYWPGEDAVGKQLYGACPNDAPALIVGVVADSKQNSLVSSVEPELYEPYAQHPSFAAFLVTFVIRTTSNPLDVAAAVRNAVWEVDHDQPVIQMRTMQEVISESIWQQHFAASALGIFGALALVLAGVGIYGVLSYSVTRRTHEIGIRSALGATRGDILRLVVGEGFLLAIIGVGVGTLAALGLTRLIASLLFGVRPRDPLTFVALSLLLIGVSLLAVYIPARRAARIDPMVALRVE